MAAAVLPSAVTSGASTVALSSARVAAGAEIARLSDGDTAYYLAGDRGPWVVLVHGVLPLGYTWEPLAKALAEQGFRVLYYDGSVAGCLIVRPWTITSICMFAS